MDIRVNNVSFNGKKEMFYGIKKLAEESATFEQKRAMTVGPHPVSMSNSISESKGKLFAYADMVMNDEFVNEGLQDASHDKNLIKYCKKVLSQKGQQYISPISVFTKTLRNAAKDLSQSAQDSLNTFITSIK